MPGYRRKREDFDAGTEEEVTSRIRGRAKLHLCVVINQVHSYKGGGRFNLFAPKVRLHC